jgi:hypothetical protein
MSVRIAIILRAVGEVFHKAAGVSDGSRTGKQHEDSIGGHRYQKSQQCAFRDGSRGVLWSSPSKQSLQLDTGKIESSPKDISV